LLDTLGTLIHAYEETHYPIPETTGVEILCFFMDGFVIIANDDWQVCDTVYHIVTDKLVESDIAYPQRS